MASTPPILIRFTPEEMAALFEQAAPDDKLDFTELLPQYSAEQQKLVIDVARSSLVARDVLRFPEGVGGRPSLHPVAQAAVAALVRDQPSLVIFRQQGTGEPISMEYHTFGPDAYLAHIVRADDVHEFAVFENAESYNQSILDAAAPSGGGKLSCPPGQVTDASLNRAIELAVGGGDQAQVQAALEGPSLPGPTAEQLAATLAGPFEFKTVIVPPADGQTAEGKVLSFLQGPNGLWQVEGRDGGQGAAQVSLQPLSNSAAQAAVRKFVAL